MPQTKWWILQASNSRCLLSVHFQVSILKLFPCYVLTFWVSHLQNRLKIKLSKYTKYTNLAFSYLLPWILCFLLIASQPLKVKSKQCLTEDYNSTCMRMIWSFNKALVFTLGTCILFTKCLIEWGAKLGESDPFLIAQLNNCNPFSVFLIKKSQESLLIL